MAEELVDSQGLDLQQPAPANYYRVAKQPGTTLAENDGRRFFMGVRLFNAQDATIIRIESLRARTN